MDLARGAAGGGGGLMSDERSGGGGGRLDFSSNGLASAGEGGGRLLLGSFGGPTTRLPSVPCASGNGREKGRQGWLPTIRLLLLSPLLFGLDCGIWKPD